MELNEYPDIPHEPRDTAEGSLGDLAKITPEDLDGTASAAEAAARAADAERQGVTDGAEPIVEIPTEQASPASGPEAAADDIAPDKDLSTAGTGLVEALQARRPARYTRDRPAPCVRAEADQTNATAGSNEESDQEAVAEVPAEPVAEAGEAEVLRRVEGDTELTIPADREAELPDNDPTSDVAPVEALDVDGRHDDPESRELGDTLPAAEGGEAPKEISPDAERESSEGLDFLSGIDPADIVQIEDDSKIYLDEDAINESLRDRDDRFRSAFVNSSVWGKEEWGGWHIRPESQVHGMRRASSQDEAIAGYKEIVGAINQAEQEVWAAEDARDKFHGARHPITQPVLAADQKVWVAKAALYKWDELHKDLVGYVSVRGARSSADRAYREPLQLSFGWKRPELVTDPNRQYTSVFEGVTVTRDPYFSMSGRTINEDYIDDNGHPTVRYVTTLGNMPGNVPEVPGIAGRATIAETRRTTRAYKQPSQEAMKQQVALYRSALKLDVPEQQGLAGVRQALSERRARGPAGKSYVMGRVGTHEQRRQYQQDMLQRQAEARNVRHPIRAVSARLRLRIDGDRKTTPRPPLAIPAY